MEIRKSLLSGPLLINLFGLSLVVLFLVAFVVIPHEAKAQFGFPSTGCNPTPSIDPATEELRNYNSGHECSAGPVQEVPVGKALTAIGYGSDDWACFFWIKTAPVNLDGSVDFSQTDTNWRGHVNCPSSSTRNNQGNEVTLNDGWNPASYPGNGAAKTLIETAVVPGKVMTGWSWGGATSGGGPGDNANSHADECYYQEYMDLRTQALSNYGDSSTGTCSSRGYPKRDLQLIVRAPAGRVLVAVRVQLDKDVDLDSMSVTYRTAPPLVVTPASFTLSDPGARDVIRGSSAVTTYSIYVENCQGNVGTINFDNSSLIFKPKPSGAITDISYSFNRSSVTCAPGDNNVILTVRPGPNAGPLSLPSGPFTDIGLEVTGRSSSASASVTPYLWVYDPPSVQLKANNQAGSISINSATQLVLSWPQTNTLNGNECNSSWAGPRQSGHNTSPSQNMGSLAPSATPYTYTITCNGAAGATASSSVSVTVTGVAVVKKLTNIVLSPVTFTIQENTWKDYTVEAYYDDGSHTDVTGNVRTTYVSLDPSRVQLGYSGVKNRAFGLAPTAAPIDNVKATYFETDTNGNIISKDGFARLTVNAAPFSLNCPALVNVSSPNNVPVQVTAQPQSGSAYSFVAGINSGPSPRPAVNPTSGSLSSPTYSQTIFVNILSTTPNGNYNLRIDATRNGVSAGCNVTLAVNMSIGGPVLQSISISPNSIQLVVGQQQPFTVIATYRDSGTGVISTVPVTANAIYTPGGNITMLGSTGQAGSVGSATVTASFGGKTDVANITVSDFSIACPSSQNLTLVGATLPANTNVTLNFTVLPVNGFNKPVTTTITDSSGANIFVPSPRVVNMGVGNYSYSLVVNMSGKGAGVYNINADSIYSIPLFSRRAIGAPCLAQIVVGAVTNYNLQFDSLIGSVMQDDNANPADNSVGSPMIHQYQIQLTNCSGGAVANGVQLKPLNFNGVTGADFAYYEETSPGNFANRGQTIVIACGQTRYLRVNARDTLAPLNPNNQPVNNRSINFMSGTAGISDKQNNLVLTLYGRPKVNSFTANPTTVTDIQSSNLAWTTSFVPTNGFYCEGVTGTGVGVWPGPKFNSLNGGVAGGTYATGNMPAGSRTFAVRCGVSFRNSLYYSTPVSTTITVNPSGSNQPINVSGDNSTCGKIAVKWQKPSTGLAPTGYKVYKFNGSSWVQMGATVNVTNPAQLDYSLLDPAPSAQNTYAVTSLQGVNESARSQASNNPVPLVVCTSNAPESVIGNNATCGRIFIDWKKPSTGLAPTSYRVYRWSGGVWVPIANVAVANVSVVDYRFEDPSPSATGNRYAVSSFQGASESAKVPASNNPIDLLSCTPNAPGITGTTSSCAGITINWSYAGVISLSRFRVYRNNAQIAEVPATQLSYQDTTPLSSNNYQVTAISTSNIESSKSNTANVGWSGCEPKLDSSNKRILSVDGVNNPFATQNPCDPNFTKLDLKARIDQPIVFLMNICNNGTAPLVAGATPAKYVIIDDTKLTHLKKNGNSWKVKIQGNSCTQFPVWSAATATSPQCQYQDASGGLRISLRNGSLPIGGIWQLQFEAITTVGPNENGDTFYFGNKATITYPKNTPPNGTKDIDTGLKTFIRGSGDGVKFIEIPPGS